MIIISLEGFQKLYPNSLIYVVCKCSEWCHIKVNIYTFFRALSKNNLVGNIPREFFNLYNLLYL